jgi:hypothetical protein
MHEEFETIKSKIHFVSLYVGDSSNSWPKVKLQIINAIPKEYRVFFQRRDEVTKKHRPPNEFEQLVINYWKELTQVDLLIPKEKEFDPTEGRKPKSCHWTIAIARQKRKEKYEKIRQEKAGAANRK